MPCIEYKSIRMNKSTKDLITKITEIIDEYQEQGYSLTLRQVYYQLVARGYIPNNDKMYRVVGNAVNDGRLAGLIDWEAIEDRTRYIRKNSHWYSPAGIIGSARYSYYMDHWENQSCYVEVWVEKDALIGIVQQAAEQWDVPCFSCRGYTSQSEMWQASQRFLDHRSRRCILIHLGDHDPSGIDMSRDIEDRLEFFGADVDISRIALNWDQIEEYNPPPNPAKITDSRARGYIDKYGATSWELDALPPDALKRLITDEILQYLDKEEWEDVEKKIDKGKAQLRALEQNWDKVLKYSFMKNIGDDDVEDD
jgi:hypothetical protein